IFFFSSRRRHTRSKRDWSSDVCSSDLKAKKEISKDPAGYKASLEASLAVLKAADWTPGALERTLRALAEQQGVAAGKIFQPIRKIGRASCRERVEGSGGAVELDKESSR